MQGVADAGDSHFLQPLQPLNSFLTLILGFGIEAGAIAVAGVGLGQSMS